MTDLAALVVRMQADNSQYIKALDQATSKLSKFAKDQESAFSQLKDQFVDLGAKFAAGFAVDKIIEFTASSIESAAALERLSQTTGISTESLSSLRLAAAASGLSADEMGIAYKKLNVSLEEAAGNSSSKAAIAFKLLGISVTDTSGNLKTVDQILPELADKFAGMADGPNKVALAVALLGKQGQNLIPVLDGGSAGLAAFKKQAEDAGLVISGDLARSAEEFSQKAAVLKASLIDGLSVRLATQLLPVLEALVASFSKAGGAGAALDTIATGMVVVFQGIASVIVVGAAQFEKFGNTIGGVAAAWDAFAHGRFTESKNIILDTLAENETINKASQDRLTAIWSAGEHAQVAAVVDGGEEKKKAAVAAAANLAAAIKSDAADQKLLQFSAGLKEQVQAFDLGGAAAVRYKLSVGQLAKDLGEAGDKGKEAAAAAIRYAEALQTKKDDKSVEAFTAGLVKQIVTLDAGALALTNYELHSGELGLTLDRQKKRGDEFRQSILAIKGILIDDQDAKAVQALADKSDVLAGRLNKAALAAFDLQNALLKKNLEAQGNVAGEAGLEQLATERAHIDAQSKINELNLKASVIQTDLGVTESKIALARSQGQITDLEAMTQQEAARATAITQLGQIYTAEQGIAAGANDPALVDGVKKFGSSIDGLKTQMNQFDSQVRTGLEGAFAHNFADLITGAKSFKQALIGFLQDIDKQFVDMIAKDYAQKLFAGASGSSAGGPLGGLSGLLGGLLGGGGGGLSSLFGGSSIAATGAGAAGVSGSAFDDLLNTVSSGGLAGGGTIPSGEMRLVGENGPELAYSGPQDMQVVPNAGKNVNVTNHFTVQSANGTISRQSQMQVAAAAARSLSQASRRNN